MKVRMWRGPMLVATAVLAAAGAVADERGAVANFGSNSVTELVRSIDTYGDLTPAATSGSVGVAAFNGFAISE